MDNGLAELQVREIGDRFNSSDENSNHKLDRNMIGFPREAFGFSNNPKVGLSAPSFNAAAMQVACPVTETTIHLIYK